MTIRSYRDLEVWQKSRQLVKLTYRMTKCFPKEELYCLTTQLRRAAISIPSNVAEGHSRHSTKDFIHFISIAIGSLAELDTQIVLAQDLEFVTIEDCEKITADIQQLQRMLHSLRKSLQAKC